MVAYNLDNPRKLATTSLIGSLILSFGFFLLVSAGMVEPYPRFYWMSACTFLMLYAIFNSVISTRVENNPNYWNTSVVVYIILAVVTGVVAWAMSGLSVFKAGSYSFLYVVITFGYLVFISVMKAVKSLIEYAQKEVWHHPKMRKRK